MTLPRLHVFDVDREKGALTVWEKILVGEEEELSRPPSMMNLDSSSEYVSLPENLDAQLNSTDYLEGGINDFDLRQKQFRLSAPPTFPPLKTDTIPGYPIPVPETEPELDELAREMTPLLRAPSPSRLGGENSPANLTLEGRRQVCYVLV